MKVWYLQFWQVKKRKRNIFPFFFFNFPLSCLLHQNIGMSITIYCTFAAHPFVFTATKTRSSSELEHFLQPAGSCGFWLEMKHAVCSWAVRDTGTHYGALRFSFWRRHILTDSSERRLLPLTFFETRFWIRTMLNCRVWCARVFALGSAASLLKSL